MRGRMMERRARLWKFPRRHLSFSNCMDNIFTLKAEKRRGKID